MARRQKVWSSIEDISLEKVTHVPKFLLEPSERGILIICGLLILSIFLFDTSLAIGFVVSILYVIPVLICIWSPNRRTIFLVAGVASLFTLVAVPLKPSGDLLIPLFNRPVSLVALWMVAFLVDRFLTERKRAEKVLRESQEDLNHAQSVSQTGSWRLNVHRNELLWSNETYRMFGIPMGTPMTYDTFLRAVHPNDRDYVDKKWQAAIRGEHYDIEHRIVVNGEVRWVREKAILEFDKDGVLQGGFGTVQDKTESKRAEEALQASQQMLQLVLNNIPQRVIWKDLDLNYLGANRTATQDAGLSDPKDIIGKNDHELAWRESADLYRTDDREVIMSGKPKLNFEEPQIQSDGRVLWLETSKVPLRDTEGNIIGVLGTYEDITEQKKMEGDLKRSNAELLQFAYVASHDLQEPLRMVTAYLSLLEKKYGHQLDGKAKQYMDFAIEGGSRAKDLVQDLLEFSRVDTQGKAFQRTNMEGVLDTVVGNLSVQVKEENANISHEPLPSIMADEGQMVQVLQNLLSNALKFHGAEVPKVHISCKDKGDRWLFSVEDNGIGIDPKYHDKVFVLFQRLHTREEYEGTGIGLAISKKIVERHGGRIWFESQPGRGTTFYFTILKELRR